MLSKLTVRNIQIGFAVIALLIVGVMFIAYQYVVGAKSDQLEQIKHATIKSRANVNLIPALEAQRDTLKQQLDDNFKQLRQSNQNTSILAKISSELDQLNVNNRQVKTYPPKNFYEFSYTPLSISFESDFKQSYELLNRLADYGHIVRIQEITINESKQYDSTTLKNDIKLFVFSSPQKDKQ